MLPTNKIIICHKCTECTADVFVMLKFTVGFTGQLGKPHEGKQPLCNWRFFFISIQKESEIKSIPDTEMFCLHKPKTMVHSTK